MLEDPKLVTDPDEESGDDIEIEFPDETPENPPKQPQAAKTPKVDDQEPEAYGKRAQKRIQQLVRERNETAARLAQLESDRQKELSELTALRTRSSAVEDRSVTESEARINAELVAAQRMYKDARSGGDEDAELEAIAAISDARTQLLALNSRKAYMQQQATLRQNQPQVPSPQVPQRDKRADEWAEKNPWINSLQDEEAEPEDQAMASLALATHMRLVRQGIDPNKDPDTYWKRLDDTVRKTYPHRFTEDQESEDEEVEVETAKKRQVTAGAPRAPAKKPTNKVKLSSADLEFSKKYGIDPKRIAQEKLKLERARG